MRKSRKERLKKQTLERGIRVGPNATRLTNNCKNCWFFEDDLEDFSFLDDMAFGEVVQEEV